MVDSATVEVSDIVEGKINGGILSDNAQRGDSNGHTNSSDSCIDTEIVSHCDNSVDSQYLKLNQPQLSMPTEFKRPFLSAKRRLSFCGKSPATPSTLCNIMADSDTNSLSGYSPDQTQEVCTDEVSESSSVAPRTNNDGDSVKRGDHILSSISYSPSGSRTLASAMAVSPLTKSLRAFHMHQSYPSLEIQHSYPLSRSSPSPPVLIPSFSFPCLLSPHPIAQPFTLEPAPQGKVHVSTSTTVVSSQPPNGKLSKSSSVVSLKESSTCSYPNSSDERVPSCQPYVSTSMITSTHQSNVVYTTPASSRTCCNSSTVSNMTSLAVLHSKSVHGNSTKRVVNLHRHLSNGVRAVNSNLKSNQPPSKGTHLKQVLMQWSPRQHTQQRTEPPFRCPRNIHCNNCGHKIDLKTFMQNLQMPKGMDSTAGNAATVPTAGKPTVPSKVNVSDAGLTVFDLEAICDTGHIDPSYSSSNIGDQQGQQFQDLLGAQDSRRSLPTAQQMFSGATAKSNKDIDDSIVRPAKTPSEFRFSTHPTAVAKPTDASHCSHFWNYFPHSDELTRSFAPIFSENMKSEMEESTVAESLAKLDSIDIDELLQLVEAASDIRYCSINSLIAHKGEGSEVVLTANQNVEESVQPAYHIIPDSVNLLHADESSVHSLEGKSSTVEETVGAMTNNDREVNNDCLSDCGKGDCGEGGVKFKEPQSRRVLRSGTTQHKVSRICKKKPRKKRPKKTN